MSAMSMVLFTPTGRAPSPSREQTSGYTQENKENTMNRFLQGAAAGLVGLTLAAGQTFAQHGYGGSGDHGGHGQRPGGASGHGMGFRGGSPSTAWGHAAPTSGG